MLRYIINRIIYLIPVLFFMSVIVFLFIHLIPGDPVDYILGLDSTPEAREALREELGLDRNILVQYVSWAGKIIVGDFGNSVVSNRPVLESILEKLPATILLTLAATLISLVIAIFVKQFMRSKVYSNSNYSYYYSNYFFMKNRRFHYRNQNKCDNNYINY